MQKLLLAWQVVRLLTALLLAKLASVDCWPCWGREQRSESFQAHLSASCILRDFSGVSSSQGSHGINELGLMQQS
jgi:hypothetical protein